MFGFVKCAKESPKITDAYINEFEKKHNIKFPEILKEFYYTYNRAELKKHYFVLHEKIKFSVEFILPITGANINVEKQLQFVYKNSRDIPKTFVPLAHDIGGQYYYWDKNDEKVYCIALGNPEHPVPVSKNVEEFFQILNESVAYGSTRDNPYYPQIDVSWRYAGEKPELWVELEKKRAEKKKSKSLLGRLFRK